MKRRKAGKEKRKELYELLKTERKKQRKEYTSFLERISEDASLSADISGELLVTMAGRHCMFIRNHTTIAEYTGERIRIKGGRHELLVEGDSLLLEYSVLDEIKVRGNIHSVIFQNRPEEV